MHICFESVPVGALDCFNRFKPNMAKAEPIIGSLS